MVVKYTVTISSIIVSHEEKIFFKSSLQSSSVFVFIYSKNNLTLKAILDWEPNGD